MEFIQIVSFRLNESLFSVDIMKVREIMKLVPITKLPASAPFLSGVINVRGDVVPVIDTRIKLGIECQEVSDESRLLLVDKDGRVIGLLVDEVLEVLTIPQDSIEPFSELESDFGYSSIVTGIVKMDDQLLTLIDTDKLI